MFSMRLLVAIAALSIFSRPASAVEFVNPPPVSGGTPNLATNPVYTEGTTLEVSWTDTADNGIPFSVVVYQADISNGTTIPADQIFEYVVHNSVNLTSSHWVVATAKNLSFSNVFVLSIFFQGDTASRAASTFFNISRFADGTQQASQTASVLTVTATVTTTATSSATAGGTPLNGNADGASSDGGLNTGAKAGIAAGAVAALALGAAVGWVAGSRRNKGAVSGGQQPGPGVGGGHGDPHGMYYAGGGAAGGGIGVLEKTVYETHGTSFRGELHGNAVRYELSGTHP